MMLSRCRVLLVVLFACGGACQSAALRTTPNLRTGLVSNSSTNESAVPDLPVVHVFVALCHKEHQGIVPVSASLADGDPPKTHPSPRPAVGIKAFFSKNKHWALDADISN